MGQQSSGGVFRHPAMLALARDAAHENADLEFLEALGEAGLSLYSALPRQPKLPWRSHP
jgi:hypothetical protein